MWRSRLRGLNGAVAISRSATRMIIIVTRTAIENRLRRQARVAAVTRRKILGALSALHLPPREV
jgi:hypothetical protein